MRFLCVSDMIDPLVYSTSVKERYGDVDAVLCAGDLPMEYVDFITDSLGKPTFFVFGNHDLEEYPYYKRGGHYAGGADATQIEQMAHGHGADYLSNRVIRHRHLTFNLPNGKTTPLLLCGVTGSMRYNNGDAQFTEREMKRQLLALAPKLFWNKLRYGRYCDVFLTHASPRHIHDKEDPCHKGFECFNWFIKKFRPALLVHGHIHSYDLAARRVTETEGTTVVNVFSHLVIDYNPEFSGEKGEVFVPNVTVRTDR